MENQVSLKVSPSEFELKCSTRTGYSTSLGLKKSEPNMLHVWMDIMEAMTVLNQYRGFRWDPSLPNVGEGWSNRGGWRFEVRSTDGYLLNGMYDSKIGPDLEAILKENEPANIDGGVNFAGGPFKLDAPDCYHIWRATFFPLNYPMQPGGLAGIASYSEGVVVADDGMVLPLDS